MNKWYDRENENSDVVISSRIRLARNFSDYKFGERLEKVDAERMVNAVVASFQKDFDNGYDYVFMNGCSDTQKKALKEQRIISSALVKSTSGAAIISKDEGTVVQVNSDDHIRIQTLECGMNLKDCFARANEIDNYIDAHFDYAFDRKYGYKTTYPTNVGTGLRAGYTLHLPALNESRKISQITSEVGRFGLKIRPLYSDDDNVYASLYQVSTQKSLGLTEEAIIKDLNDIVWQIVNQERSQRQYLYEKDKYHAEDVAYKSYGVLKYARKLSYRDAMSLLSEFMLGVSLDIIKLKNPSGLAINRILMDIQPAVINNTAPKAISVDDTEILRARYMRNNLPEIV